MLALALLLQAAIPQEPDVDPVASETKAVLAAFKDVCWTGPDTEKAANAATARGWTPVKSGEQIVADRMRASAEATAKPDYQVSVRQFARTVQSRALLLTIERGQLTAQAAESFGSTRCLIRELGDPQPLDVLTVQKWLGRMPDDMSQYADGSLFLSWSGLDLGGPTNVMAAYFPPTSKYVAPEFPAGIYLSTEAYGPYGAKPKK